MRVSIFQSLIYYPMVNCIMGNQFGLLHRDHDLPAEIMELKSGTLRVKKYRQIPKLTASKINIILIKI